MALPALPGTWKNENYMTWFTLQKLISKTPRGFLNYTVEGYKISVAIPIIKRIYC